MMRKLLFCLFTCFNFVSNSPMAQPLSVGSTVKDISLTDINGNTFSLYDYLARGYTVLVDVSATWCGPCWSFEQAGTGQSLYNHYGPNGTMIPKKLLYLFIEGDPRTNADDLKGTGRNTQGDWITNKKYPIVDAVDWTVAQHFLQPGASKISFPTFLMICPDKKVIWSSEGFNPSQDEAFLVKQMGACGTTTIKEGLSSTSFQIYPNPASEFLQINLSTVASTRVYINVCNVLGQTVLQQQTEVRPGDPSLTIGLQSLPKGVYILSLQCSNGAHVQQRFVRE